MKKMLDGKKLKETAFGGLIKNNPVFCLVLGMCPTIAMSSTLNQAVAMGLAVTFVLIFSNLIISSLRKVIPDKIRIPCFIIIISTFVIIVEMVMRKFLPDLYGTMKTFISLIVVNCIILARAESFASCNEPFYSAVDGLSMGLGFTFAVSIIACIREFLGGGSLYGHKIFSWWPEMSNGAGKSAFGFIVLACVMAAFKYFINKKKEIK